jgi:cytochrome c biogenesis protein CcmG, thiol:disulfide interchange protein DsbE
VSKNNILRQLFRSIHSTIEGMKKITAFITLLLICSMGFGQNDMPDIKLKTLTGDEIRFNTLGKDNDTILIVSLWATWCVPCIQELEAISDQYEDRQKETPFKLIAVSIDDSRTTQRVKPFVKGKGWPFEIYLDVNSDLKRALNINDVPHILIIKNGKIVYQHNGYVAGNEEELFEKMKTL